MTTLDLETSTPPTRGPRRPPPPTSSLPPPIGCRANAGGFGGCPPSDRQNFGDPNVKTPRSGRLERAGGSRHVRRARHARRRRHRRRQSRRPERVETPSHALNRGGAVATEALYSTSKSATAYAVSSSNACCDLSMRPTAGGRPGTWPMAGKRLCLALLVRLRGLDARTELVR